MVIHLLFCKELGHVLSFYYMQAPLIVVTIFISIIGYSCRSPLVIFCQT